MSWSCRAMNLNNDQNRSSVHKGWNLITIKHVLVFNMSNTHLWFICKQTQLPMSCIIKDADAKPLPPPNTKMHHKQFHIPPFSPPISMLRVSNKNMLPSSPEKNSIIALTTTAETQFYLLPWVSDHGCAPVSLRVRDARLSHCLEHPPFCGHVTLLSSK